LVSVITKRRPRRSGGDAPEGKKVTYKIFEGSGVLRNIGRAGKREQEGQPSSAPIREEIETTKAVEMACGKILEELGGRKKVCKEVAQETELESGGGGRGSRFRQVSNHIEGERRKGKWERKRPGAKSQSRGSGRWEQ